MRRIITLLLCSALAVLILQPVPLKVNTQSVNTVAALDDPPPPPPPWPPMKA